MSLLCGLVRGCRYFRTTFLAVLSKVDLYSCRPCLPGQSLTCREDV